jgi:hypothetical protein
VTNTLARTHLLVLWRFQTPDDTAPVRAAADDVNRVIAFSEQESADIFAGRLRAYGLDAHPYPVTSTMVAELLDHNGRHDPDDVVVFEAQTVDAQDAVTWAQELADRMFALLAAEFEASQRP